MTKRKKNKLTIPPRFDFAKKTGGTTEPKQLLLRIFAKFQYI
jgi:hypothetical protein